MATMGHRFAKAVLSLALALAFVCVGLGVFVMVSADTQGVPSDVGIIGLWLAAAVLVVVVVLFFLIRAVFALGVRRGAAESPSRDAEGATGPRP
ncbi:hypothetical protein [Nocardioides sp.]|uniref:hypothetical protein n=1 Tax=Nocardioides sp. TaxID=35761 RepID=UPI003569FD11